MGAGGIVVDEEQGGVVAGVAVFFEEERGAEPGGEGLAALAVGIEDVAKVVVVGAEGGVVFGEAVEHAEVGLEGLDLLAATELGDGEGVERGGGVLGKGDGGHEGKRDGGLFFGGEQEHPGGSVAECEVVGVGSEGFDVTFRNGGAIVPIAKDGSGDKVVGEGVVADFMGKIGEAEEEEGALVLVGVYAWQTGHRKGNHPIGGTEGTLCGGRGEGQREEAEEGEQTAH